MEKQTLRKVRYRLLLCYPGYSPDRTEMEEAEIQTQLEEQNGWFHGWTEVPELSPNSGCEIIVKKALVETETGEILVLSPSLVKFIDIPA